jgi:hypothetical protein
VIGRTKKMEIKEVMAHMGNSKCHNFAKTMKRLEELQVRRSPYLAFSPDMSPCDFWFVGCSGM